MSSIHLISRWLLLIVSLTILSPQFAQGIMASEDHHNSVPVMLAAHELLDHDHDADRSGAGHADHHAGDGYLFTHLPAQVSASPQIFAAVTQDDFVAAVAPASASRAPDRLERPPRPRSA